jgi:hypothetical protein
MGPASVVPPTPEAAVVPPAPEAAAIALQEPQAVAVTHPTAVVVSTVHHHSSGCESHGGHQLEKPVACFVGSRPTTLRLESAPRLPPVSRLHGADLTSTQAAPPALVLITTLANCQVAARGTLSRQATPSNPHRPLLLDLASSPAVSFSEGFRTPASSSCGSLSACRRPASENLYIYRLS